MNAIDMFQWLCGNVDKKCGASHITSRGYRWACVLPKGHEGDHGRVTMCIRRFDWRGHTATYEVDSMTSAAEFQQTQSRQGARRSDGQIHYEGCACELCCFEEMGG